MRSKLATPVGRHLYGVLGTYAALDRFAERLKEAKTVDGKPFSRPVSVNRGILDAIPDEELKELVKNEAKRPEPTAAYVKKAFDRFLRDGLQEQSFLVLMKIELLFAYNVDLSLLRTLAADERRILLLRPGRKSGDRIVMFPETGDGDLNYSLPTNLIAMDRLWQLEDH